MGSVFEQDALSNALEAPERHRRRSPAAPPEALVTRMQQSAGNQSVARWLAQAHRPVLQRELKRGKANDDVKAYLLGTKQLVQAKVTKPFTVGARTFSGMASIKITMVHDGTKYVAPAKDMVVAVDIDPLHLFDEYEEDDDILARYATATPVVIPAAAEGLELDDDAEKEQESESEGEAEDERIAPDGEMVQLQKRQREILNKLAGQKELILALDEVTTGAKYKDGDHVVRGFTLHKRGRDVAIILFRKMSVAEAEVMSAAKTVSRKEHADPYKWFSESAKHGEGFSSGASGAVLCKVILDADKYLAMRAAVQPEHGATAQGSNRFHQERLGQTSMQVNFAVHDVEEAAFNKAILRVVPAEEGVKLNTRRGAKAGNKTKGSKKKEKKEKVVETS